MYNMYYEQFENWFFLIHYTCMSFKIHNLKEIYMYVKKKKSSYKLNDPLESLKTFYGDIELFRFHHLHRCEHSNIANVCHSMLSKTETRALNYEELHFDS